jgi:hypothetical protein
MKKLLLACALLLAGPAFAQNTVTLTPSVTSGNGSISTTLTWSTAPAANSCTASGHASWTGEKGPSGTLALPVISTSGSYTLTLNCTWPGDTTATIHWTPPTTNTDGSALAKCASQTVTSGPCLLTYKVFRSNSSAGAGEESRVVNDRNAIDYAWTGLAVGTHWFSVSVSNANGVESDLALPRVSKTITGSVAKTASATVTVNPKPSSAGGLSVE